MGLFPHFFKNFDFGRFVENIFLNIVPGFGFAIEAAAIGGDVLTKIAQKLPAGVQAATAQAFSESQLRQLASVGVQAKHTFTFAGGKQIRIFTGGNIPIQLPPPRIDPLVANAEFIRQFSEIQRSVGLEGTAMAFNIGGFLQGVGGLGTMLGQQFQNPFLQGAGQLATAFGSGFTPQMAPAPMPASFFPPAPVFTPTFTPQATPVMAAAVPAIRATSAAAVLTGTLLAKMAARFGIRNLSLRGALARIRSLGKLMEPTVVAAAIGLTSAELAHLIVSGQGKKRRRTNPANVHALRRSIRRIQSFHRLCGQADVLRRSRSRGPAVRFGRRRKAKC